MDRSTDSTGRLLRMTDTVTSEELQWMVLDRAQLPAGFSGFELAEILEVATVVHLFERPEHVDRWIDDVFVGDFRDRVGAEEPDGQRLMGVETLKVSGFHEHAAALLVVHEAPEGTVLASTIVDFRLGRLLGVAYIVAKRDTAFTELATELGIGLERQMVRTVLDA